MLSDQAGRPIYAGRWAGVPIIISLSVAAALSSALEKNSLYRMWSSVDSFFLQGDNTVSATTSSHPLKAGLDTLLTTDETNIFVSAIVASGTGTLFLSKIDVNAKGAS